jgi:carbamoyltransferase
MITWGISANSHDGALAVFDDDRLLFASHTERFSGLKNDPHLNQKIVKYAIQLAGDPDLVCWYERPIPKFTRQVYAGQNIKECWHEIHIKNYLVSYGIRAPIKYGSHHESHAAGAFYTSPFSSCAVLSIDSIGEWNTTTIWKANSTGLEKLWSMNYPNSIGLWYSAMTQRCGLKANEEEYILMGMAAFGDKHRLAERIENDFFNTKINLHRGCKWWAPELTTEQDMFDIAAATQHIYERKFKELLYKAKEITGENRIALAGGCALNCVANEWAWVMFDDVWIFPNPGDAGSSVGAVLAHRKQKLVWEHCNWGYDIPGDYPIKNTLEILLKGLPVGVANGQAEFGPRALGNRSLLADPRSNTVKDRVNEIKRRQKFRPFAPAILEEYADEYFELHGKTSRFMQYAVLCKKPHALPAIIHYDGTSRVQTVPKDNTGFRKLLEAWYEETGCPILLNTSLNIKGKPMVNDSLDAEEFRKKYSVPVFTHSEQRL